MTVYVLFSAGQVAAYDKGMDVMTSGDILVIFDRNRQQIAWHREWYAAGLTLETVEVWRRAFAPPQYVEPTKDINDDDALSSVPPCTCKGAPLGPGSRHTSSCPHASILKGR